MAPSTISDRPLNIPSHVVALNSDTLIFLLSCFAFKDLLSTMLTCRRLFREGLPILLGRRIRIRSFKLESFHRFLTFTAPHSFAALRELEVPLDFFGVDGIYITDILKKSIDLRALTIDGSMLDMNFDAVSSIASLPKLQSLTFIHLEPTSRKILQILTRLRSPLKRLDLCWMVKDLTESCNVFADLQTAQVGNTLEEISLSGALLSSSHDGLCFPKVSCLKINSCPEFLLSSVVPVFPNIRTLIIYGELNYSKPDSYRLANRDYQQLHGSWTSLEFVKASIRSLYSMSLQCEVHTLFVHAIMPHAGVLNQDINILKYSVLPLLRLRHLRIYFNMRMEIDSLTLAEAARSLLRSDGLQGLRRLDIKLFFHCRHEKEYEIMLSLRNIVEGIKSQSIPLEVLETCFEFHSDPDKPRRDTAFNLSCYSMESIPTLQYIKSSIKPIPKAIETYYWKVSKTDGKSVLHQVSQDDRNAVHTIERMLMPSEVHPLDYAFNPYD